MTCLSQVLQLDFSSSCVAAMKRSFPWDDSAEVLSHDSSSSNSSLPPPPTHHFPLPDPAVGITSQDILIKRAEMYQADMKRIPIPSHRGSVIPYTSWIGLGISIKKLYEQPLHYLTNVLLKQWDQLRMDDEDYYKPLDNVIHPCKAEATIWLMEEVHRKTTSHFHIAKLWMVDPMYNSFIDSFSPTLEH